MREQTFVVTPTKYNANEDEYDILMLNNYTLKVRQSKSYLIRYNIFGFFLYMHIIMVFAKHISSQVES